MTWQYRVIRPRYFIGVYQYRTQLNALITHPIWIQAESNQTHFICLGLPLSHCRVLFSVYHSSSNSYITEPFQVLYPKILNNIMLYKTSGKKILWEFCCLASKIKILTCCWNPSSVMNNEWLLIALNCVSPLWELFPC